MVQRREAVHGVAVAQRGRRRGAERRQRPSVVGDLTGYQLAVDGGERHERDVFGQSRVGPIPAGQLDLVRVDLLHVDHVVVAGQQVQIAGFATAEHQNLQRQSAGGLEIGRVREDLADTAEPRRRGEVGVGRHQHRDRAEPRQRRDGHQRARAGFHQHPDAVALADADLDQAAHDVVDAGVDGVVGVHPAVEQQELALDGWSAACSAMIRPSEMRVCSLIWPRRASRGSVRAVSTASVRIDLLAATTAVPADAGKVEHHLGGHPGAVRDARSERHATVAVLGRLRGHSRDARGHVALAGQPLHPRRDGRPALRRGLCPDDEAEMPGADEVFVDIRIRRGALNSAYRRGLADVVDLADERQDRNVDVVERDQFAVNREAAGHHPVVGDELR